MNKKDLKKTGVKISIDDFGSGFSALNLLKDLPVDTVKLDKGFLHNSSNTSRGRQVIRSVIAMCRDLKIQVVTEGIETAEQVDFITKCSCQTAQGFYYSQPVPVGEFEVFAEKHKENIRRRINSLRQLVREVNIRRNFLRISPRQTFKPILVNFIARAE